MKGMFFSYLSILSISVFAFSILDRENEKPEHHFDWSGIRKEVRDTLVLIDAYGILDGHFRGNGGNSTCQFSRIEWFRKNVKKAELEKLAHYPSAPIKALVFLRLLGKQDPLAIEMIRWNLSDTTYIYSGSGCVYQVDKLNVFMMDHLNSMICFVPEYENYLSEELRDSLNVAIGNGASAGNGLTGNE